MSNSLNTLTSQKRKPSNKEPEVGFSSSLQPLGSIWVYVCTEILLHLLKSHIGNAWSEVWPPQIRAGDRLTAQTKGCFSPRPPGGQAQDLERPTGAGAPPRYWDEKPF